MQIKKVASPTKYIAKDGQEKTKWINVGVCFETDGKQRIKLDAMPLPNKEGEIWLYLFEQDNKGDIPY